MQTKTEMMRRRLLIMMNVAEEEFVVDGFKSVVVSAIVVEPH
jgi:hypothetical protein